MVSIDFESASDAPRSRGLLARIGGFLSALTVAQSRADAVERLNAKSDEELASIGLRREDIVQYVYRDILYI